MADAGIAARRVCEQMIEQGLVKVNGKTVQRLPVFVDPETDEIDVEGRRLQKPQRRMYLMVHKPAGVIVSTADEPDMGRTTIMDLVTHPSAPRLFPVGRLDFDTTGLVILTNDGELANRLTHPRFRVPKTYQALVKGRIDERAMGDIRGKVKALTERELGKSIEPPKIQIIKQDVDRTLLELILEEGPARQLYDAFALLGMPIKKLTRTAIGGLELRGLALAAWRELSRDEVSMLRQGKQPRKQGNRPERKRAQVIMGRRMPPKGAKPARNDDDQSKGGRSRTRPSGRASATSETPSRGRPPRAGAARGQDTRASRPPRPTKQGRTSAPRAPGPSTGRPRRGRSR